MWPGNSLTARPTGVGLWGAIALCILLATLSRGELEQARGRPPAAVELLLFPSGRFLQELSMGHPQLLADAAWLTAIQYYGKHRLGDRRYPLAPHLFTVMTDADPHFLNAYLFGALVMGEAGYVGRAEQLLERGLARNPGSWRMPFELGFFRYVYTRDWGLAAEAFAEAARRPEAPEYVVRFAAASFEKAGEARMAAALWETIAETSANPEIREIARERLTALAGSGTPGQAL